MKESNQLSLKSSLGEGDISIGSWITLAHPAIAEIMAKAGFDWLAVDLEHSVITIREAEELIRVIDLCGVAPLVRLTSNDPNLIKRVMDAGAHGVIAPMVNSKEDAEKVVESLHYPTKGKRGVGLARAQGYGASFNKYKDWLSKEAIIIVQIEHVKAVENIEEIFSVESVDGFIIGPYDLSASMGVPGEFENLDVVEGISRIHAAAKKLNKPGGIHIIEPNPDELMQRIGEGFKFLAYSLDIRMIDQSCRQALAPINQEYRRKKI